MCLILVSEATVCPFAAKECPILKMLGCPGTIALCAIIGGGIYYFKYMKKEEASGE